MAGEMYAPDHSFFYGASVCSACNYSYVALRCVLPEYLSLSNDYS